MTIAVLSNDHSWTYNLRREVLSRLLADGHRVVLLLPYGSLVDKLVEMGCEFIDVPYESHGMNPVKELSLYRRYKKHLKALCPDLVLSYTIKPNVYGGLACRSLKIPYIVNITGLGSALHAGGIMQKVVGMLYKAGIRGAYKVFFQNTADRDFMLSRSMVKCAYEVLPGSGVNTDHYRTDAYPADGTCEFLFISRVLTVKGAREYFAAARTLHKKYPFARFRICGLCDEEYKAELESLVKEGVIHYYGPLVDIRTALDVAHCTVLPSYFEGMANALLESASYSRPVVATDVPGCRETFCDGVSGFSCAVRSAESLTEAMEKFINLPYEEKRKMGEAGRAWVVERFDRKLVLGAYLETVSEFEKKHK